MHLRQFPEMPERLLTNMKRRGSITVFLSLILVLMFSFILTTLEAARIRGATAYVSMLSELAGDSFLASYYYPLFKEYRIFGVNAGDENGFFRESILTEDLTKNVSYGMEEGKGGLIKFQGTEVLLDSYETLLSSEEEGFLKQVREQVALDGLSLALSEVFSEEAFQEAGAVGEVYQRQEEVLEEIATVTGELLRLMELCDGVRMSNQGIAFDKNGKMQVEGAFIKQLVPMEQREMKAAYDSEEVFRTISGSFYRADRAAERIRSLFSEADQLDWEVVSLDSQISSYESTLYFLETQIKEEQESEKIQELEKQMEETRNALTDAEKRKSQCVSGKENALEDAKTEYKRLQQKLESVKSLLEEALEIVEALEKKQKKAQASVKAYEAFLNGKSGTFSRELYQVFSKELETMKIYAGLEENGYSTETMGNSLKTNLALLESFSLEGFSENETSRVSAEMRTIIRQMPQYTVEGLWFSYGDIVVAKTRVQNVTGALGELLSNGILGLVGVPEEALSERELSGKDLVSAGFEKNTMLEELMAFTTDAVQLLQGGEFSQALKQAGNALLDGTALELYAMKYFRCYGEESPCSKLNYEREYLVFGAEKDKTNLLYMVLHLVAIRMLFTMVMILKQPDRMASLETLSLGITGFTGMPVLGSIVKYGLLLLWSVEEALVEVAALLQGKRVALVGTGSISFEEIFLCSKTLIAEKAGALSGAGPNYKEYLVLLSLTRGTKVKAYRSLDLIQENIRYRYNDGFRIRNLVTGLTFTTHTTLKKQFDTGFFGDTVYLMDWKNECAY